ncbi:MAG: DUF5302 family protein [Actinomycetota bacterium]
MSEKKPEDESRAKFLAALEKKKVRGASGTGGGPASGSKVGGGQAAGGAPKRFQRKSGSA